jgi:hypothetical protein
VYGDKKGRWALHGGDGLAEDERFPEKGETSRAFLVKCKLEAKP